MGIVSAIGCDEETFWQNLVSGQAGIARVTAFDPSDYKSQLGAEVDSQLISDALAARQWKSIDRTVDMALVASSEALESAGVYSAEEPEPHRTAVIVGSAGGSSLSTEDGYQRFAEMGLRGLRPTTVPRCMVNAVSSHISMKFRLTGPNYVIAAACSASTHALGVGFRMIRDGHAERVLCGGADSCFAPVLFGAWDKLGVMSRNPDAEKASRPFDVDRDGFVLGEGAGMVLMETRDSAVKRGARIRGEISGYGESSDAEHITRPSEEGQAGAMLAAMKSAGIEPKDVDFINAHGTATKANDECESHSIRIAMKDAASDVLVASNKSFFGHTMGASGAMETIATLLGMEAGRVPPNLNLDSPDPAVDLHFAPGQATDFACNIVMKNSFGFGGSNAVLILKRA
jgi:3-oxoacyl-[acyl-carrier-protein] synthase II